MTEATAAEVESSMTFPNLATRAVGFHWEVGKVNWSTDRIGAADWSTIFRTGATGNSSVQLDTVKLQRVSSDGNTIRATITVVSGATDAMGADTNITNNATADTSLDNPVGAASTDHLAVTFICDNTHEHGGDEVTSCEQNTSGSTRLVVPIDDAVTGFVHSQGYIIG
jgi:hypothetical protein